MTGLEKRESSGNDALNPIHSRLEMEMQTKKPSPLLRISRPMYLATLLTCFVCHGVAAKEGLMERIAEATSGGVSHAAVVLPAGARVEVGFSPDEGAESLVLKVIRSAQKEIRLLGYSFTSVPITQALLDAKHRGVDVAMIVDHKNNVSEDRSGKARHALSALVSAGVRVRTISIFAIHHDKTVIVDGQHVETGSFNFSDAAAHKNSENVLVLWNVPELAKIYLRHWEERYARGQNFEPNY